jgi:lipid II:glycine glycyltransferase (peptidoglycan interpeptide bridge formation enzyme)
METLRAFFELHLGVRKYKYRLLAQPYCFFENIWRQFIEEQRGSLMIAAYEGEIIGGVMFLEWKDGLYYKFNASAPASLSLRPNDLLIWEGIQYGKAKGCTYLDFGLSDWDQEGLLRYKRKFATVEKTISFLRYSPNGASAQQAQQGADFLPQLTQLFTDEAVPDQVTEKAGEVLYRFFT